MSEQKSSAGGAKWVLVALGGAAIGAAAVLLLTSRPDQTKPDSPPPVVDLGPGPTETPAEEGEAKTAPVSIDEVAPAAIVAEVRSPAKLRAMVLGNEWAKEALVSPTGRGFLGSWAGFLGTRGEDVGGLFAGTVLEFLAERVLANPFQVVWFGGRAAPGSPALVVPEASGAARAAFAAIDKASRRGTIEGQCPTPGAGPMAAVAPTMRVARWLLADHSVFAAIDGHRIVLAREPKALLNAVCDVPPRVAGDADVALELRSAGLGREVQQLEALVGAKGPLRLELGIENGTLVPKGIAGELAHPERLAATPIPQSLLRAVPAGMPVVLGLGLQLPEELDGASLRAHLAGEKTKTVTRHAVVVWRPHGNRSSSETAIVWSRAEDARALQEATAADWEYVCDQPAYASSLTLVEELRRTCGGQNPSLLNGAPQVAQGLGRPLSVALGIDFGSALSSVTTEAYVEETGAKKLPVEMEEARRLLEALPFFGLGGVVEGSKLLPGGFRS